MNPWTGAAGILVWDTLPWHTFGLLMTISYCWNVPACLYIASDHVRPSMDTIHHLVMAASSFMMPHVTDNRLFQTGFMTKTRFPPRGVPPEVSPPRCPQGSGGCRVWNDSIEVLSSVFYLRFRGWISGGTSGLNTDSRGCDASVEASWCVHFLKWSFMKNWIHL